MHSREPLISLVAKKECPDATDLIQTYFLLKYFECVVEVEYVRMALFMRWKEQGEGEEEEALGLHYEYIHSPLTHLSANTSKGLFPWAQLRTIQAESMPARKPRAMPVPIGQKGCRNRRKNKKYIRLLSNQQTVTDKIQTKRHLGRIGFSFHSLRQFSHEAETRTQNNAEQANTFPSVFRS